MSILSEQLVLATTPILRENIKVNMQSGQVLPPWVAQNDKKN